MIRGNGARQRAFSTLKNFQVDRLFRRVNRSRILILAYHGVTKTRYGVFPPTQIPLETFQRQMAFITRHYCVVTLRQAVEAITACGQLPANAAVITFDDGYRNNLTVALPILEKYGAVATIFLTAGYIGSQEILPIDQLYLLSINPKIELPIPDEETAHRQLPFASGQESRRSYEVLAEQFKRLTPEKRQEYIDTMKSITTNTNVERQLLEDFCLLSEDDIKQLTESRIIEFGSHSVSHRILTTLGYDEARKEIVDSKRIIEKYVEHEVNLFAYPNGTDLDYNDEHIQLLKAHDFICGVGTKPTLNALDENPYRLGRMCITSSKLNSNNEFALRLCGFTSALKLLWGKLQV